MWARARRGAVTAVVIAGVLLGALIIGVGRPAAGSTSAKCVDGPRPDPLLPPAAGTEALVAWAAGASFWDREARAQNLTIAAYADGTVVRASNSGGIWSPFPDATLGWAGPCQVAGAADRLREMARVQLADVAVTDVPTAHILVRPFQGEPEAAISVYAMDRRFDEFTRQSDATRVAIRRVVEGLRDAPGAEPWYPDRFRLERFHDPYFPVRQPPARWPGPRSIAETVGDDDCTEIGDRMIDADGVDQFRPPVSWWTDEGGAQSLLGISVLFPGEPACPARRPPSR